LRKILRAFLLVAALSAVGGVLGGIAVAGLLLAMFAAPGGSGGLDLSTAAAITLYSCGFGAAFGVVLGPALGWAFMRRVPLGRAIGETAFAAACGVGVAFIWPVTPFAPFVMPVLAATAAALRLRYVHRRRPDSETLEAGAS
jgi:hypothetical protein